MTRILVIDDEQLVRSLMVELLERAGYEVLESESATRSLELLDDPRVSLVLSDVLMPGLTGLELLQEVQRRRPGLPVLLVTGAGTQDNLAEARGSGAAGVLLKPFSASDLVDRVEKAIEHAGRGADREGVLIAPER
jgi:DNA-binding NtrC family response regulator